MTRSAHASQVQIVEIVADGASQNSDVEYRSDATASPLLPQRRCQSLGRFPGDVDGGGHHHQTIDEQGSLIISSKRPKQFLCVPQAYPSSGNKSYHRRRRASKSLDLIPSELRLKLNQHSPLPSCTSQEDVEDEHTRLLDEENQSNSVVLTIPNGNQSEQATHSDLSRPNGHIKPSGYQAVKMFHNDDEGIDVNSESLSGRTQRKSLSASGHVEPEKRWHSCEQLQRSSLLTSGDKRVRETKDTPIASTVNKSVKQWIVNFFGVGHGSGTFTRNPPTAEDFTDIHRDDRESVV